MINVSAASLSLIYQKCEHRSGHRSQLKIRAPLLQSLPACEPSLRAEHKRAPLINALLIFKALLCVIEVRAGADDKGQMLKEATGNSFTF